MILTVVTTGIFLSVFMNKLTTDADRSKELEVFNEALTVVRKDYVEDIPSKDLIHNAIQGMIGSLDAHSDSIPLEQHHKMQNDTKDIFIRNLLETTEVKPDSSGELKLFNDTFAIVRKNYEDDRQPKHLIYGAIKGMAASLDPHSEFMTPEQYKEMQVDAEGEFGGIGIKSDIKEGMLTVTDLLDGTPAFRGGLSEGDKIIKINNESTKEMGLQDAISKMRGIPSTTVKLTIFREGWKETKDFTIVRGIIKIDSVKAKMMEDGIGYIKIYQFQKQTASDFSAALSRLMQDNMNSLVIDLRDNPGGLLYSAVDVASRFIPSEKLVVYTKDRKGNKKEYRSRKNNSYSAVPMVVVVNGGSASASEILAGALKDWQRAAIVGTTTYGKGSVQTVVPLKDGSALRLTTAKYYTPKGISIQTTGISPDILVKPKIEKGQQVRLVKREKDLEGHLTNVGTEKLVVSDEIVPITIHETEDVQLRSAIHLLKTGSFRNRNSAYAGNVLRETPVNNM